MRRQRVTFALLLLLAAQRAQSGALEGYVTDPDGQPVAGASVWSVQSWTVKEGEAQRVETLSREGVSGAEGQFVLDGLREDIMVKLYACLDGHAIGTSQVWDLSSPAWIALNPPIRISGQIRDSKGRPVAGAEVKVPILDQLPNSFACSQGYSTLSSRNGSFHLEPVPTGDWSLEVRPQGFVSARRFDLQRFEDQSLDEVEIVLSPEATITGIVRDLEGKPVSGALVRTLVKALAEPQISSNTATDGTYQLRGIPAGEHEVEVSYKGHTTERRTVSVAAGKNHCDLTLGPKWKQILGRVVGPEGEPISGSTFLLASSDSGPCGFTTTQADGSFSLNVFRPQKKGMVCEILINRHGYFLTPSKPSFVMGHEPIDPIEVRLHRSSSITGRVLGVQPEDLSRVRIQGTFGSSSGPGSGSAQGSPDAEGLYRLKGLDSQALVNPGQIQVSAWLGLRRIQHEVTLKPGQEAVLDLEFPPALSVHGRAISPDGEGLEGVEIELENSFGHLETQTRADGSFSLEVGNGEYKLTAMREGYVRTDLELTVSDVPVENLEIHLQAGAQIRGRILGLEPWEKALISMEGPRPFTYAQVDRDWSYRSADLPAGKWEVTATVFSELSDVGSRSARTGVTLQPGEEALVDLDLGAGPWTLSGRLFKAGEPIATSFHVQSEEDSSLSHELESRVDGSFRLPEIRAGIYRLQVPDPETGEIQERIFEISSDFDLIFELPEAPTSLP